MLYKKILRVMPVLTVDLVIVWRGKFLLVKRASPPFRGAWWIPGGRFQKGETFESAAHRLAKEETGLDIKIIKLLGVGDMYEQRWGIRVHSIGVVYLVRPKDISRLQVNRESKEVAWFKKAPNKLHPVVKRFLNTAGLG